MNQFDSVTVSLNLFLGVCLSLVCYKYGSVVSIFSVVYPDVVHICRYFIGHSIGVNILNCGLAMSLRLSKNVISLHVKNLPSNGSSEVTPLPEIGFIYTKYFSRQTI